MKKDKKIITKNPDIAERKRKEEEASRMVTVVRDSNDAITIQDFEGHILAWNRGAEEMFGYSEKEALKMTVWQLAPLDKAAEQKDFNRRIFAGDKVVSFETQRVTKDGRILDIWLTVTKLMDDADQVIGIASTERDITERKRAEQALKEAKDFAENLINLANVIVVILDAKGNVTLLNETGEKITGYMANEAIGKSWFDLVVPRKRFPYVWDEFEKLKSEGVIIDAFENPILTKSGEERFISWKNSTLNIDGKFVGTMSLGMDITEHKEREEAFSLSEAFLNGIIEQSPESLWISDSEGTMIRMNPACRELFRITDEEVVGKYNLFKDNLIEQQGFMPLVEAVFRKGEIARFTTDYDLPRVEHIKLSGAMHRIIEVVISPIKDLSGKVTNAIIQHKDVTERKRAEEKLRKSEAKFQDTIKYLDEGYYSVTLDGTLLAHNIAFNKILGIDPQRDRKGTKLPDFWQNPEDRKEYLKEFMAKGFINNYLINAKTIDGKPVFVIANAHLVKDENGKPTRIDGTFMDITERMRAEEALRKSEETYRTLVSNLNAGVVVHAADTRILFSNQMASVVLGLTSDQMLGKTAMDPSWYFVREDNSVLPLEEFPVNKVISEKKPLSNYVVGINIPGKKERTWVLCTGFPVLGADGDIQQAIITFIDITERKRAEEMLRIKNIVFDASIATNSIADMSGNITEANDAFLRVWGYPSKDEVIGKPLPQFINDQKEAIAIVTALNNTGQWEGDYTAKRKDGSTFIAHGQATTVKDEKGTVIGYQAAVIDVTGQREAEKEIKKLNESLERRVRERTIELQASNKELEAFAYSVSHDLRAPLRTIDGFSHALLEDYADKLDVQGKDYLRRVRASTQMMAQLIDDILKLSRVTRTEMNIEKVNLAQIARSVIDELQKSQPERLINIKIADGLEDTADSRLMRQALENLLGNAWKFTGKQAEAVIEFGATKEGGRKVYFIRDNGAGFDMAYVDKLFAPFQRLHTMEEYPGTGIGLATVRRIINRHGGRVWAEGQVGKGAVFYFSLQEY